MYIFISQDLNSMCKIHLLSSKKPWQTDRILPCYSKNRSQETSRHWKYSGLVLTEMVCVYVCMCVWSLAWQYWTQCSEQEPSVVVLAVLVMVYRQGEPQIQTFPPALMATGCISDVCVQIFSHHSWSEQSCDRHLRVFTDNQHSGFIWL